MRKATWTLVLTMLLGILPTAARAEVGLYVAFIDQQNGTDFTLIVYGTAEQSNCAEEPYVDANVYLFKQPGNNLLASSSNAGYCSASAETSLTQDGMSWQDGEYEARVTSSGHGCISLPGGLAIKILFYEWASLETPDTARYVRCNPGSHCSQTWVTLASLGNPPWFPQYVYRNMLVWYPAWPFDWVYVCYYMAAAGYPICAPDPIP